VSATHSHHPCQIFSGIGAAAAAAKGETSADLQQIEEEDKETSSDHNFTTHMPHVEEALLQVAIILILITIMSRESRHHHRLIPLDVQFIGSQFQRCTSCNNNTHLIDIPLHILLFILHVLLHRQISTSMLVLIPALLRGL
jgi:hypothetical protein